MFSAGDAWPAGRPPREDLHAVTPVRAAEKQAHVLSKFLKKMWTFTKTYTLQDKDNGTGAVFQISSGSSY